VENAVPEPPVIHLPFSSRHGPGKDAAADRNLRWARRHGLISTPADERRYLSWDIADLMTRWLPLAQGPGLDLGVDVVTVATLMDDQFDGPLAVRPAEVADACGAMLEILEPGGSPVLPGTLGAAFADVWDRMCHGASPEWRMRAARHWRWFLEAFPEEARVRTQRTRQSRAGFFGLRRKSGFVYSMLDLIEAAYGFEISPRAYKLPAVQRMLDLTADVVSTINDLYSVQKEESRGDVHNFVLIIQEEQQCTRGQAITDALSYIDAWCEEFIRHEERLPADCAQHHLTAEESAVLSRLSTGMRDAMGSFPVWSQGSGRYSQLVPAGEAAYSELLSGTPPDPAGIGKRGLPSCQAISATKRLPRRPRRPRHRF
jgi:hypothetical protein